jgi:hypothetical protein
MGKKELTPEEMLTQIRAEYMDELGNWEFIHQYGCSDPFWPDGCNLNLIRSHCIWYQKQMEEICKENSLPVPETPPLPAEVDEDFMAPYGRFPNRLAKGKPDQDVQLCLEF